MQECLSEVEDADENDADFLDRRVRKHFRGHGDFDGIVTSVDSADDGSDKNLFFVTYEDGDTEELWYHELKKILLPSLPDTEENALVRKIYRKIKSHSAEEVCLLVCNIVFYCLRNLFNA